MEHIPSLASKASARFASKLTADLLLTLAPLSEVKRSHKSSKQPVPRPPFEKSAAHIILQPSTGSFLGHVGNLNTTLSWKA